MTTTSGDPLVFIILFFVFLALSIYLFIYNKKKSNLMLSIAQRHGMKFYEADSLGIEEKLNEHFAVEKWSEKEILRSFSKVKDVIEIECNTYLFRCQELLCLNKYRTEHISNFYRIAICFPVHDNLSVYLRLTNKNAYYHYAYGNPGDRNNEQILLKIENNLKELLNILNIKKVNYLSVSFNKGLGLVYFEHRIAGGESKDDIEKLIVISNKIRVMLADCQF